VALLSTMYRPYSTKSTATQCYEYYCYSTSSNNTAIDIYIVLLVLLAGVVRRVLLHML
jgi:hypothetical protein